jgi:hypothetical protein
MTSAAIPCTFTCDRWREVVQVSEVLMSVFESTPSDDVSSHPLHFLLVMNGANVSKCLSSL